MSGRMASLLVSSVVCLLLVSPAAAQVCTRWVSPAGSDGGTGSQTDPWRSIEHAASAVTAGDVVCIGAGTYVPADGEATFEVSGTSQSPIVFTTQGEDVTVEGGLTFDQGTSHVQIDGLRIQGFSVWGVTVLGDNRGIALSGLEITGGEAGIRLTVGDSGDDPAYGPVIGVTIEQSTISDCVYSGLDCTPGPCNDLTLSELEIFAAGVSAGFAGDGIAVERGANILVEDCHIHDNGGDGIDLNSRDLGDDMPGIVVRRNRVGRNGTNGIKAWAGGRIVNNLVFDSGSTALVLESGSYEIVNNTFASIGTYDYLAILGNYDALHPATVRLFNNIFSNDDPEMGGVMVFIPELVTLTADHNLYYNPHRDDLICAANLAGEPCFTPGDINGGAWTAASGQGAHSLSADPLYFAGAADDHHLTASSPAVDAGSAAEAPTSDLDGLPRDAAPDIGAYEYRAAGGCTVACGATVPASAPVGTGVTFTSDVTTAGCDGQPSSQWDFGDGASAAGGDATHVYDQTGLYTWTLTVTVDEETCTASGVISVLDSGLDWSCAVPAVVHTPGAAGTQWRTDVAAFNPSSQPAQVRLTLLADDDELVETTTIAPFSSTEWTDMAVSLFGAAASDSTSGILHVAAEHRLLITSRTYNQGAEGTYGQYLPALTAADGFSAVGYLLQLESSADFRCNLGLVNLANTAQDVRITLYDATGAAVGRQHTETVQPGAWVQINEVFDDLDAGSVASGFAELELVAGDGPVWAYASVVDNATGDATTIPVLME